MKYPSKGYVQMGLIIAMAVSGLPIFITHEVQAQLIPDTTLGAESSIVTPVEQLNDRIDGGAIRDTNVFHSFSEFNVGEGRGVYFASPAGIENIFSRVTGSNPSNILGKLGVSGNANLFFLNPNGIVFGENASLDMLGSFLATTANSINFADGSQFSATPSQAPPILRVSVPIGLGFTGTPGSIINRSQTTAISPFGFPTPVGLQVGPGKTLALVGGDVLLEGGSLTSAGGHLELGSVAGSGIVNLTSTGSDWVLGYEGIQTPNSQGRIYGDIQLSNLAKVDASGLGGGSIQVQSQRVRLTGGSRILADTLGPFSGGRLTVNATESVEVIGTVPVTGPYDPLLASIGIRVPLQSGLSTSTFGSGSGGDLKIQTGKLQILDGAEVEAESYGPGAGGNVLIKASESVEVAGATTLPSGQSLLSGFKIPSEFNERFFIEINASSSLSTAAVSSGSAGNLTIHTGKLIVRDGGLVTANPFGTGAGGRLDVFASDSVQVLGTSADGIVPSSISSASLGGGKGGDLTITAPQLIIRDGAGVNTSASSTGDAGNLTVNVSDKVEVRGRSADKHFPANLTAQTSGSGNAGDLTINTGRLIVEDDAGVAVSGSHSGFAGNLQISAELIQLKNQGTVTAATVAGDGGNIQINTNALIALKNSSISANAFDGQGGNIQITAQGVFLSPDSTITASSQLGIEGTVDVNTPDIDIESSLDQLETNFVEPDQVIAGSCLARRNVQRGSFVVTGTGGFPYNPYDGLRGTYTLRSIQPLNGAGAEVHNHSAEAQNRSEISSPTTQLKENTVGAESPNLEQERSMNSSQLTGVDIYSKSPTSYHRLGDPIEEAKGIVVNSKGRLLLVTNQQQAMIAAQDLVCHRN